MKIRHLVLVSLFLYTHMASAEEKSELSISGIYSNLMYNDESGDLQGMEVFIIPRNGPDNSYQAFVQAIKGGAPSTFLVPVIVEGGKINLRFLKMTHLQRSTLWEGSRSKNLFFIKTKKKRTI